MIKEYTLRLKRRGGEAPLEYADAYPLYAALLELAGTRTAQNLHEEGRPSLSQYLMPMEGGAGALWRITLWKKEEQEEIAPLLTKNREFTLRSKKTTLTVEEKSVIEISSLSELLEIPGANRDASRFFLRFLSPASYRSGGEYQIFPSVRHIVRSAAQTWNDVFPENSMDDEEAMSMLEAGVKITGYNLKSVYYALKGNKIPAFCGTATLNPRLSAPMLQLLRALLSLGTLCGTGIKTTLGMGGMKATESPR